MRIGITGLIVIAMMLVMVPYAVGDAVDMTGQLEFEDGTPCGEGIRVCVENLNETIAGEPWCEDSFVDQGYIYWDYLVTGEASSEEKYIRTFAYTTDGRWEGEATHKLIDVRDDQVGTHYIFDIVLYEVPEETENFTKFLPEGWNLISLPLAPLDSSTGAVLGNVSIVYNAVKQYDATTKTFADATTMVPGTGYFVHVTNAGDWTYEGTAVDLTSPGLKEGLNMIGVPNCTMSVGAAMGTADYRYVARWNAVDQKFEVHNPNAPAAFYGFTEMTAGEGYFVSAKSDGAFGINC